MTAAKFQILPVFEAPEKQPEQEANQRMCQIKRDEPSSRMVGSEDQVNAQNRRSSMTGAGDCCHSDIGSRMSQISLNQPSVAAHQTKAHGRDCNFTSTSGSKRLGRRWQSPRRWRGSHARLQLRSVLRHASCGWVQVQAERTRATSSCGCGL